MKTLLPVLLALFSLPSLAQDDLGGPGESCRARSDCRRGLACRSSVCVTTDREGAACGATRECGGGGLRCIQQVCTRSAATLAVRSAPVSAEREAPSRASIDVPTFAAAAPAPSAPLPAAPAPAYPPAPPASPPPPPAFAQPPAPVAQPEVQPEAEPENSLDGNHGYVGGSVGIGVVGFQAEFQSYYSYESTGLLIGPAVPLAVSGGVWLHRVDLHLEVSPATDLWMVGGLVLPNVQLSFSVGYFAPFYQRGSFAVGWPLRLGAGLSLNWVTGLRASASLIGVAFRFGKVHLEVNVPTANLYLGGGRTAFSMPVNVSFNFLF
jgi:hypothetical protein